MVSITLLLSAVAAATLTFSGVATAMPHKEKPVPPIFVGNDDPPYRKPTMAAVRLVQYSGGFMDHSYIDTNAEPGWEKKRFYYLQGIDGWDAAGNNATVQALYNDFTERYNYDEPKHLLQFSWGVDELGHCFAMFMLYGEPNGSNSGQQIEKALLAVGGPTEIKVEKGVVYFNDAPKDYYLSVQALAETKPRPFRFHFDRWVDILNAPSKALTLDDLYLGKICLGLDGMGQGCSNPCKPAITYDGGSKWMPAPPCLPY